MLESQLLFLDTETTGNTSEDRVCQVAYKFRNETDEQLFKPPVPIKLMAMSVTHITNRMVDEQPSFAMSFMRTKLTEYSGQDVLLVAHNAQFDLDMMKKEGVNFPHFICSLKLARHIDKGNKYESHKLQYLRYFYDIELDGNIVAHTALSDVLVLEKVFEKLIEELMALEGLTYDEAILRAKEISKLPSEFRMFTFGKYNGRPIAEVVRYDRGYVEWLLKAKMEKPNEEADWIYTLTRALQ